MGALILLLLLALILGGTGFTPHILWWIVVVAVLWLLGFVFRSAGSGGSRGRWYRW
ncbi:hydrophobic protein [Streptomyces sp. N50]|nr:hydrophobic protein [Streptomyces sp. N50]WOX15885.1 hydrophobic protein [Streptomyces sp. N50]